MNAWRHEIVAKCVHHKKRRQPGSVAEVVPKISLGQCRAGARLDSDGAQLFAVDLIGQKWEGDAAGSFDPPPQQPITMSGYSPAMASCFLASSPMTDWW